MRHFGRACAPLAAPLASLAIVALAVSHCGTDAVGIDACRNIESARCEAAPSCPNVTETSWTEGDVLECKRFYRDQCLHGVEDVTHTPSEVEVKACVDAIAGTAKCAKSGNPTMAECNVPLVADVSPSAITPCAAILETVHLLAKCAFLRSLGEGGADGSGGSSSAVGSNGGGGTDSAGGGNGGGGSDGGGGNGGER